MAVFAVLALLTAACDSQFDTAKAYPSPDGRFVVEVVTKLQGANDNEPFWQHVSLHEGGVPKEKGRANLLIYSGAEPTVEWKSAKDLHIVAKDVGDSFEGPFVSRELSSIELTLTVERAKGAGRGH